MILFIVETIIFRINLQELMIIWFEQYRYCGWHVIIDIDDHVVGFSIDTLTRDRTT